MALCKIALEDLKESGLSSEIIKIAGFESHSAAQISKAVKGSSLDKLLTVDGGYTIPYFDLAGNKTSFTRFKVFGLKGCKYLSAVGSGYSIYIPPMALTIAKAKGYLIITEGEKKALKGVQEGLPVIAIAGIDAWANLEARDIERASKLRLSHNSRVHSLILDAIKTSDVKRVLILGDSDTYLHSSMTTDVSRGRRLKILADAVRTQCIGITVAQAACRYDGNGKKIGLDDWLISNRSAAVKDIENWLDSQAETFAGVRGLDIATFLRTKMTPPKPILGGWFRERNLCLVYAPRGLGKTQFSIEVALAIASGSDCFGWSCEQPQGILYVDGEMSGCEMQARISAVIVSRKIEPQKPFVIINPDISPKIPDLSSDKGRTDIEDLAIRQNCKVIVLDNLSCLCSGGGYSENDAQSWNEIQSWAVGMRSRGFAILFVHHSGKGGQQRGTSKREDVLDVVVALRKPDDVDDDAGAYFNIVFEKNRGVYGDAVKSKSAQLSTNADGIRTWEIKDLAEERAHQIRLLLADGLSIRDIAKELDISKSAAQRAVTKVKAEAL